MSRLFHVFRSKRRLWTRCGQRATSHVFVLDPRTAKDEWYWIGVSPLRDAVICVHCARRCGHVAFLDQN